MHIGVQLKKLCGVLDSRLIISRQVPENEVCVIGETATVRFSPLEAWLTLEKQAALDFAETISHSHHSHGLNVSQSQQPVAGFLMPYGKHKNKSLSSIPRGYLTWLVEQAHAKKRPSLIEAIEQFLKNKP